MSDFCQPSPVRCPGAARLAALLTGKWRAALSLLAVVGLAAGLTACGVQAPEASSFDHRHSLWDQVLKRHVSAQGHQTVFDYRALSQERSRFDAYLEQLHAVERQDFDSWTEDQQLAFLINAYNAFTVKWILRHYPIGSIRETADHPWGVEFIELLGRKRTLDQIEHEMIRPVFGEPLIHFAVNCAAAGCPPLRGEAFAAERLDSQLQDSADAFLQTESHNRVEDGVLYLSSIFDWYGDDFNQRYGGVLPFVAERLADDPETAAAIRSGELEVRYVEYDWSLNEPDSTSAPAQQGGP